MNLHLSILVVQCIDNLLLCGKPTPPPRPAYPPHTAHFDTSHFTLHTSHCTLHTAHFTLHTSHFTLHTSHFTLHTPHFTLHTSHFTLHTTHYTLNTSHFTLHAEHFSELHSGHYFCLTHFHTAIPPTSVHRLIIN